MKEDTSSEKDNDSDDDDESILDVNARDKESSEGDEKKDTNPKIIREMKKLQGWFNPDASRMVETSKSGRDLIVEQADIALMIPQGTQDSKL